MPVTIGLGLMAGSGAGVDFRHIPESNGTHASLVALDIVAGAGVDLTDRLSLGASIVLSQATMDGPFVGITGSSTDYALRGALGLAYELRPDTTVGIFWKSKAGYTFENLVNFPNLLPGTYLDVSADRPQSWGLGVANQSLLNGRLLLACDAVYQQYTETAMFGELFNDQWALQFDGNSDRSMETVFVDCFGSYDLGRDLLGWEANKLGIKAGKWKMPFNRSREETVPAAVYRALDGEPFFRHQSQHRRRFVWRSGHLRHAPGL